MKNHGRRTGRHRGSSGERDSLTGNTTFITDTTRAPFHLLDLGADTNNNGIPLPDSGYGEPRPASNNDSKGGS